MKIKKYFSIIPLLLLFTSCYDFSGDGITETFDESNRPGIEYDVAGDYFLVKPWNYEKEYNADRKYPLLIYLHGSSQIKYLKNLYYMGMGYYEWSDSVKNMTQEYQKERADAFRKKYPCFMYVPQGPSGWNTAKLIAQIEKLKTDYRIDANRMYLHGFSMGGSGSYSLANGYYAYNRQLFAGIIRQSGGGTLNNNGIAAKTAVWLIVGLRTSGGGAEGQGTIDNTRAAYNYLKNYAENSGADETCRPYIVETHSGSICELVKKGWEFAKKTEFTDDGHFTTEYPFRDPSVMEWLFSQSIAGR